MDEPSMDRLKQIIFKVVLLGLAVTLANGKSVHRHEEYDNLESCSKRISEETSVPLHEECSFTTSCKRSNKFAECIFKSPNYCICEIPLEVQERIGNTLEEDWEETPCDYGWGYYNNSCFLFHAAQMIRVEAKYFCESEREGSHLVSFHSKEEVDFAYHVYGTHVHNIWLGLYDTWEHWKHNKANYQYDDNTEVDYMVFRQTHYEVAPKYLYEKEWCVIAATTDFFKFESRECMDRKWNCPLCRYYLDKPVEDRSSSLCNPEIPREKRSLIYDECSSSANCEYLQECVYKRPNYCRCEYPVRNPEEYVEEEEEEGGEEEEEEEEEGENEIEELIDGEKVLEEQETIAQRLINIEKELEDFKNNDLQNYDRSCSNNIPEESAVPLGEECSFTSNCKKTNKMAECIYHSPNYCTCFINSDVEERVEREHEKMTDKRILPYIVPRSAVRIITPEISMLYMKLNTLYKPCKHRWIQFGKYCYKGMIVGRGYYRCLRTCQHSVPDSFLMSDYTLEIQDFISLFISNTLIYYAGMRDRAFHHKQYFFHYAWDVGVKLRYVTWWSTEPNHGEPYMNCIEVQPHNPPKVYQVFCHDFNRMDSLCMYYTEPLERVPTE